LPVLWSFSLLALTRLLHHVGSGALTTHGQTFWLTNCHHNGNRHTLFAIFLRHLAWFSVHHKFSPWLTYFIHLAAKKLTTPDRAEAMTIPIQKPPFDWFANSSNALTSLLNWET